MSKSKLLLLAVVVLLKVAAAVDSEENPNYPKVNYKTFRSQKISCLVPLLLFQIQDEESTQLPSDVNQEDLLTINDLTEGKEYNGKSNDSTSLNVRRWAPW